MADDTIQPTAAIADPAPLGLAGFALTTFVLSVHNAGWAPDLVWLGPALFYGGIAQLLAGMWEFRWSASVNRAVFGVFLTLEITEILLFVGFFAGQPAGHGLIMVGGWVGVLTALVAWYASAAGVANAMAQRPVVPVGGPLWDLSGGPTRPGSPIPRIEANSGPSRTG